MKIALLSEKYTPDIGGLAISAGRFAHLMASAGHSVRVLAPTASLPASETRTLTHQGVSVTRFGIHKRTDDTLLDWFELLTKEHQREPFDVLHAYFLTQAGFIATFAGNYLKLPSVVSARGNDLERAIFDPSRAAHVLYALQHASAVTTNAQELARKARALIPGLNVTVIPNGIDTRLFRPLARNHALANTLGLHSPVIGFVGELREKKGLCALLNGYAQPGRQLPARLLIVGDVRTGEDKHSFDEFRLANPDLQIKITGFVSPNDLPSYYALMDILVMPSLRDGLPNALLEAMACEKAVIASSVGGILDIVTDGENGRLIPVNDVNSLANSIEELLSDKALAKRFGAAARETVLRNFTLKAEQEENLRIYRQFGLNA